METYKITLLKMRDEVLAEIATDDQSSVVTLDQGMVGRLSRMDAMQTQQIALDVQRRRQRRLQAIDGALKRIETGEFGYCYVCDVEINEDRLRFDPTTTRCKACTVKA